MAQADGVVANGTGSAVRADINGQLAALFTNHSGSTQPATTFAFQTWADTNTNTLKLRNSSNDGWVQLARLDGQFDAKTFNSNITLNAQSDLRFADSDSSNWVAFQAPATVASNVTWTLPSADGTADQALVTNGSGTLSWADSGGGDNITEGNTSAEVVDTGSDGHFKVITEGTEALRVDPSQRLLVGTSTSLSVDGFASDLQLEATSFTASQSIVRHGGPAAIRLGRSGGGSIGSTTIVASGNELGALRFIGADGSDFDSLAAQITCAVDGTPGANDMPGRLVFSTSADGAASPTERLRITSDGTLQLRNSPGIDFSQIQTNASGMTSETLDSYEEGTWDPVYNFSTSGDATVVSAGRYIKVGSFVYVQGYVYINSSNSLSGVVAIAGLPFAASSSPSQRKASFSIGSARRFPEDHVYLRLMLEPGSSAIKMLNNDTSASDDARMTNANFTAQAEYNILTFSGSYTV